MAPSKSSSSRHSQQETPAKKRKRNPRTNAEELDQDSSSNGIDITTSSQPSGFFNQPTNKLAQIALAGLSEADSDPSLTVQHFPHRGLGRGRTDGEEKSDNDDDEDDDDDGGGGGGGGGGRQSTSRPQEDDRKGHLDVLLRSIEQFLEQGEISKAARAYGLVLQLRPRSQVIDIRRYNLWAIGAEILMRQGQDQHHHQQPPPKRQPSMPARGDESGHRQTLQMPTPPRWGSAANMSKVKAYFETLIRQHPYDQRFPNRVSAIDFWLAMLSCEVYNAHAEYTAGLARLDEQVPKGNWDDDSVQEDESDLTGLGEDAALYEEKPSFGTDGPIKHHNEPREERLKRRKDDVRKQALDTMRDVTQRMEKLMEQPPYSKNSHFLRLRAAASLFAADLCLPIMSDTSPLQRREAETRRALEQRVASNAIQELENNATDAGAMSHAMFDSYLLNKEHLRTSPAHLYSSLPIRKV